MDRIVERTERLVIRALRPSDYEAFVSGFASCGPARNRFDEGSLDTSFMTRSWYEGLLGRRRREAEADCCRMLNVFLAADGSSVGYCDVTTLLRDDLQLAKIGYTLHNTHWEMGLGTELVGALVRIGLLHLGFHRLEAHVNLDNPASRRVLAKNGFELEGVRRGFVLEKGVWTDNEVWYRTAPTDEKNAGADKNGGAR